VIIAENQISSQMQPTSFYQSNYFLDKTHRFNIFKMEICRDPKTTTGNFYVDDEILAEVGVKDFTSYACNPGNSVFLSFLKILYILICES
jgi:hypothetical protein